MLVTNLRYSLRRDFFKLESATGFGVASFSALRLSVSLSLSLARSLALAKHRAKVAMLACIGYIVPEYFRFPGQDIIKALRVSGCCERLLRMLHARNCVPKGAGS